MSQTYKVTVPVRCCVWNSIVSSCSVVAALHVIYALFVYVN